MSKGRTRTSCSTPRRKTFEARSSSTDGFSEDLNSYTSHVTDARFAEREPPSPRLPDRGGRRYRRRDRQHHQGVHRGQRREDPLQGDRLRSLWRAERRTEAVAPCEEEAQSRVRGRIEVRGGPTAEIGKGRLRGRPGGRGGVQKEGKPQPWRIPVKPLMFTLMAS